MLIKKFLNDTTTVCSFVGPYFAYMLKNQLFYFL